MQKLTQTQFEKLLTDLNVPADVDRGFLYDCYSDALYGVEGLNSTTPSLNAYQLNHIQLILYILNEMSLYATMYPPEVLKTDEFERQLLSTAVDKYYTNEHLSWQDSRLTNRYLPEISTITLYLNFILSMLDKYPSGDPGKTLLVDVMKKGFSMARCVINLLTGGFETEAFSTWRTLHENECILIVLVSYGAPVIKSYLEHMQYALAFRNILPKEQGDALFVKIKDEMKVHGLKSKDTKRFIEYGWLYAVPGIDKIEDFKLNFRDGVERVANLREKAKIYEMSSEIAHSSPLLIYSRKEYFYLLTILNVYESFIRLEKIFTALYLSNVPEAERKRYMAMRSVYGSQIDAIINHERALLMKLKDK